jgi:hypothetical protein
MLLEVKKSQVLFSNFSPNHTEPLSFEKKTMSIELFILRLNMFNILGYAILLQRKYMNAALLSGIDVDN